MARSEKRARRVACGHPSRASATHQLPGRICNGRTALLELRLSYCVIMIIFDASTLILMAKIELLNPFLAGVKLRVAIPAEVERECCGVKKTLDALMIQKALEESRIQVMAVRNHKLIAKLQADFGLGKGEAEAIALALKEKAQLLGIDDKNGINASKLLGIPFTTAVGILVGSREKCMLDHRDALAKLTALAQYGRYKHAIVEDARRKMEQRK
jgi:predicted nucleic acid-binding protein